MRVFCASGEAQRIEVSVPAATGPLHGHLVLVIAKKDKPEPRMQMTENYESAQGFGVDVDGLAPGQPMVVDAATFGYPIRSLKDLQAGDYFVQAVFNVYEEFHLASGKTVWLPPDKGEGQKWNAKPGNLFNAPVTLHWDAKAPATVKLTLDKVIPPIEGLDQDPAVIAAKDPAAKWLKYMRFKSEKLSAFWGRDTYLGAWVLLPDGFDEHPDAKYPLVVYQDHFHARSGPSFFATKPDAAADGPRGAATGYQLFQDWTSGRLPRVMVQHSAARPRPKPCAPSGCRP